jgi:hypothetical protein
LGRDGTPRDIPNENPDPVPFYGVSRDGGKAVPPSHGTPLDTLIAIKAVNDSVGTDGIIPTLFVFEVYPRITDNLAPSVIVIKRTETIRKTIKEIKTLYAYR